MLVPRTLACENAVTHGTAKLCMLDQKERDAFMSGLARPNMTYATCAVVGASGALLERNFGRDIDAHDAVFRVNSAPTRGHERHVGARTTWRVVSMDEYSAFDQYPRRWLRSGHASMQDIPRTPLFAITCHWPYDGRCRPSRMRQVFHNSSSTFYMDSRLVVSFQNLHFKGAHQKTMNTGFVAIVAAVQLCGRVRVYGFSNGKCPHRCYHYYECSHSERHFYTDWRATNGYHNFRVHAGVLRRISDIYENVTVEQMCTMKK